MSTEIKTTWKSWKPISDDFRLSELTAIHYPLKEKAGIVFDVIEEGKIKRTLQIKFSTFITFRIADESHRYTNLQEFSHDQLLSGSLFYSDKSEYIDWITSQSSLVMENWSLKHYIIATTDTEWIDIITKDEPEVAWLTNN